MSKFVPGIAFIYQEVLDLNMAGTSISAQARARTNSYNLGNSTFNSSGTGNGFSFLFIFFDKNHVSKQFAIFL